MPKGKQINLENLLKYPFVDLFLLKSTAFSANRHRYAYLNVWLLAKNGCFNPKREDLGGQK